MELRDLIGALEAPMLMGADNVDITNIQSDSRRVTKGSLFVAVRGTAVDGHAYMDSAIEKGAVAIVCEEAPSYLEGRCSFIVVKDSAEALGLLVSRWYGDPSGKNSGSSQLDDMTTEHIQFVLIPSFFGSILST